MSPARVGSVGSGSSAFVARHRIDHDESEERLDREDAAPSEFVERVRRGDTIGIFTVAAFFFAVAASGQLFASFDPESSRTYAKVDADKILKEDFQRDSSSVMFDDT